MRRRVEVLPILKEFYHLDLVALVTPVALGALYALIFLVALVVMVALEALVALWHVVLVFPAA